MKSKQKCDWCGEEVDRVVPAPFPEVGWICERCYLNYKPKKETKQKRKWGEIIDENSPI